MPTSTTEPVREGALDEGALIRRVLPLPAIIRATLAVTGISFEQLVNVYRSPATIAAKRVIVHLARLHTHASYPEIARACGKTSHSSWIGSQWQFDALRDKPWGQWSDGTGRPDSETLSQLAGRALSLARDIWEHDHSGRELPYCPACGRAKEVECP